MNTAEEPYRSIHRNLNSDIGFIEFDDTGAYHDATQIKDVVSLIRKTPRPLVVTYVHGWQNNAAPKRQLMVFKAFCERLALASHLLPRNFRVIGIFLGWRGRLTDLPIVKELTFYNRKAAAERLANNFDFQGAIAAIASAARDHHRREDRYTILCGHSFGGLIVERAVAVSVNFALHHDLPSDQIMPSDVTLLINPASDSLLTSQLIQALGDRHTDGDRPLIVSVTSSADAATGTAFRIAMSLEARTRQLTQSERSLYVATPGHNPLLINHVTRKVGAAPPLANGLPAFEMNLSGKLPKNTFVIPNRNGSNELWRFEKTGRTDVPYWDVRVAPEIIRNHGDVWSDRSQAMMTAIFRLTNPAIFSY